MGLAGSISLMTGPEFLPWDADQTTRHEFVRGEVFAMVGAGEAHVTLAGNLYRALRNHLAGSPCRVFITDMKLQVRAADSYFYTDMMVTFSAADAADPLVKREPVLVVEVLSPFTAAHDRGDKFAAYRTLPSLAEYLLADPDSRRVDPYHNGADGSWVLHPGEPGDGVELASVGLRITPAALWAEMPAR